MNYSVCMSVTLPRGPSSHAIEVLLSVSQGTSAASNVTQRTMRMLAKNTPAGRSSLANLYCAHGACSSVHSSINHFTNREVQQQ